MHMPSGFLPDSLLFLCNIVAIAGCLIALWRADKKWLAGWRAGLQIGVVYILLCGLYMLQANIKPGMGMHWLGVMLTVMMLGPWLAILLLSAVHLSLWHGFGLGGLDTLGFNIGICVIAPVAVAATVHTLVYYYLPRILPVYIAKAGGGDLLCMLAVDGMLTFTLFAFFDYPAFVIWEDFTFILALMGGMEALITTWLVSILVCFLPAWLVTFNDEEYLHGK